MFMEEWNQLWLALLRKVPNAHVWYMCKGRVTPPTQETAEFETQHGHGSLIRE